MRIALVGWWPLSGRIIGGAEAAVVHLARGLYEMGDAEVHVVLCHSQLTRRETLTMDGVIVHCLPRQRFQRWTFHRRDVGDMVQKLREIQPDVVHGQGSLAYAHAALASGFPAVITVHGVIRREAALAHNLKDALIWRFDQMYERYVLKQARDIVAISPYVLDEYRSFTSARMHLIENPVREAYFKLPACSSDGGHGTARNRNGYGSSCYPEKAVQSLIFLCAARVIPRKDILNLLNAFARVYQRYPGAHLRIAGETDSKPDYFSRCQAFVREQDLGAAVTFLGWCNEEQMLAEYARCTALVLASRQETAPIAIEQAMAAGRPVVATQVGGVAYLLDEGRAGLLAPPGDSQALAKAMLWLVARPESGQRLAQEARSQAERRFRRSSVAAQTRELYEVVIAEARRVGV